MENVKCIDPHVEKAAVDALRSSIAESKSRIELLDEFTFEVGSEELRTFIDLLDRLLGTPSFALALAKCSSLVYKPKLPDTAAARMNEPWETWCSKCWTYLHEMHGSNFTWDACNKPYALIVVGLAMRCGCGLRADHSICEQCSEVELYDLCAGGGFFPATDAALAHIIRKHNLRLASSNDHHIENIGDVLECCGAMCDTTQLKPRQLQSSLMELFPLASSGATSFTLVEESDRPVDDFFRMVNHMLIQLSSMTVKLWKTAEDKGLRCSDVLEMLQQI